MQFSFVNIRKGGCQKKQKKKEEEEKPAFSPVCTHSLPPQCVSKYSRKKGWNFLKKEKDSSKLTPTEFIIFFPFCSASCLSFNFLVLVGTKKS